MATLEQLSAALVKADAAGDSEAARAFAGEIRRMRGAEPETTLAQDIKQGAGNLVAGAVRGAGSIGATLLAPIDVAKDALSGKGLSLESNRQRRADMDAALQTMGAEPDSWMYKGGKLAGEIAGTAGAGGAIANTAAKVAPKLVSVAPSLIDAVRTGGFAVNGAKGLPALVSRVVGGGVTGGVSAGLVNPEDAGIGAAIGGALPVAAQGIGKAAMAAGRGIRGNAVSPEVAALAERANQLGIDIPADRIANSKPLNALAATLNYVPGSGRAATEEKMFSQLNKAVSKTFGQDSDNVTQALRKAQNELGGEFERVLKANKVTLDPQFANDLVEASATASKELGSDGARIIENQIDEILGKAAQTGEIDGQAAYNIKKTLDRIGKRSTPEGHYAIDLKNSLMQALDRSLGPQEAAAFKATRQQYGNMLSLEKIAQNGGDGDISIARLANMKNIRSPDLQELADISAQFLKSREGNHGAAQRTLLGLSGAVLGGVPAMAAGAAGSRLTNVLLNSQTAKNAVLGRTSSGQATSNALQRLLPVAYQSGQLSGP
jgi:hypothetical protein